ncbi:hypothetical protein Tco_0857282 [Tanacetum coccineum]|uniref:Uncharacterized protein n=1 Tax=Tanacetum coccineum TaxID=301880 RepID=A0ABQ5B664_9ASTR
MKVKESLNVTFDESHPPTKLSPLLDDDVSEDEAIENNMKVVNNNIEDESIEVDEVVNIKESKIHPLEQVIGSLNQRTRIRYFPRLRQDQDHCLTLKNTPYPHQKIRRIRYFGQHSEQARFSSNTPYSEAPIRIFSGG